MTNGRKLLDLVETITPFSSSENIVQPLGAAMALYEEFGSGGSIFCPVKALGSSRCVAVVKTLKWNASIGSAYLFQILGGESPYVPKSPMTRWRLSESELCNLRKSADYTDFLEKLRASEFFPKVPIELDVDVVALLQKTIQPI